MNDQSTSTTNGSHLTKLAAAEARATHLAAETADKIQHTASKAAAEAEESANDLQSHFASIEAQLRETGEHLLASAKDMGGAAGVQLRAHPLLAIGAVFVGGIVISQLLRSKGR